MPKRLYGCAGAVEANRNYPLRISISPLHWRTSASWMRQGLQCGPALALDPSFTIRRYRAKYR